MLLILFASKEDNDLYFNITYPKLIKLLKKKYYILLLVKDILSRIYRFKYFIRLNFITSFIKPYICLDSKDITTFTTSLKAYLF